MLLPVTSSVPAGLWLGSWLKAHTVVVVNFCGDEFWFKKLSEFIHLPAHFCWPYTFYCPIIPLASLFLLSFLFCFHIFLLSPFFLTLQSQWTIDVTLISSWFAVSLFAALLSFFPWFSSVSKHFPEFRGKLLIFLVMLYYKPKVNFSLHLILNAWL